MDVGVKVLARSEFEELLPQTIDLFGRVFGRDVSESALRWRYLDAPVPDVLAAGAFAGDRLVASYSASPVMLAHRGQEVRSALSLNTMTNPDFAGRGLFTALARALYETMAAQGYALIWGFPNRNSHVGFVERLGWSDIAEIPTLRLDIGDREIGDPPAAEPDDGFELDYGDGVWSSDALQVVKDARWLSWRFAANPRNSYSNLAIAAGTRVRGFCVLKRWEGGADLVEIQGVDRTVRRALVEAAVAWSRANGATALNTWAPLRSELHIELERAGFVSTGPVTYFGGRALDLALRADAAAYASWSLRMSDSDIY